MATVDIIIPAYNAEAFLAAAIDSVVAQTFPDWRILLVDDGSKDSTPEIAARYAAHLGARLLIIRQPNAGLPAARNTALRHATAELVALLDADDIWLPRRLELSVAAFRNRPEVGLAYGFNARIDPDGRVLDTFAQRKPHAEGHVARYIYMRELDLPCPTVTFRRQAAEEAGLFDETLNASEDRDLWVRIALRYQVALVPEVIAHYRVSPQAMTTDPERMFRAQERFIEKHHGQPGLDHKARNVAYGWIYRQRAEALALKKQPRAALGSALHALSSNPSDARNVRTALSLLLRMNWLFSKG